MAVYTHLDPADFEALKAHYNLAAITRAEPIAEGVENTNYLLGTMPAGADTPSREVPAILTLFEARVASENLPFFLKLKQHLHARGLPCPLPWPTRDGALTCQIRQKPACLVSFVPGRAVAHPAHTHRSQCGALLAALHQAGADFPMRRACTLDLPAQAGLLARIEVASARLPEAGMLTLAREELERTRTLEAPGLPHGIIHGDLFPDNLFFDADGKVCGVIDFYFACHAPLLYDLAIAINAWCCDAEGRPNPQACEALLAGYEATRPLKPPEREAMPAMLRAAALRFLLSRLHDWLYCPKDALVTPHDPGHYQRILEHHRRHAALA